MADWYGTSRSNYVRVKPDALKILRQIFEIEVVENMDGLTAILSKDYHGATPTIDEIDAETEELLFDLGVENADNIDDQVGLLDVIHHVLQEVEVAVCIEAGAEKQRYISGNATAIDHEGQVLKQISLSDIYEPNWTRAEY